MNSAQLIQFLVAVLTSIRVPVLIKGAPGIGKSEIVAQACKAANLPFLTIIPALMQAFDFMGLPTKTGTAQKPTADFLPFGILRQLIEANKPIVCFVDDMGQASESVQKALMQLIHGRTLNGFRISDHVIFVAATNRVEDRAGVSNVITPLLSRMVIVDLEVSHESFMEFAIPSGRFMPEVLAFLSRYPDALFAFDSSHGRKLENSACPRTWELLSKVYAQGQGVLPVAVGTVGQEYGRKFQAFYETFQTLGNLPAQALVNPDATPLPDGLDKRFMVSVALSNIVDSDNVDNGAKYVARLGAEIESAFWSFATYRDEAFKDSLSYANTLSRRGF